MTNPYEKVFKPMPEDNKMIQAEKLSPQEKERRLAQKLDIASRRLADAEKERKEKKQHRFKIDNSTAKLNTRQQPRSPERHPGI